MPELRPAADTDGLTDGVVLCANHRLARHLRQAHDRARVAAGQVRWQPLQALTVDQWLAALVTEALLAGQVAAAAAPRRFLSPLEERLLWERVIQADLAGDPAAEAGLFDPAGLAATAQEANELMETWNVGAGADPGEAAGEEGRRFLGWRAAFRRRCAEAAWLEPARARRWRIGRLAEGAGRLPAQVMFAGFDRYTPQELWLARVLADRGVALLALAAEAAPPAPAAVAAQADRQAECRAAAAWVARRLAAQPAARLAIVTPALGTVRHLLADALDASLLPAAFAPAGAELPRPYNFSLGAPLAGQPLVATALALLRLAASPRRVDLAGFGALLLGPGWSADETEADGRARLALRLQERLAPTVTLLRLARFARHEAAADAPVPRLAAHLQALLAVATPAGRQPPSAWAQAFRGWLAAAGWPGERRLTSHEYQARQAFEEVLGLLAGLDPLLGPVAAVEAAARLADLCRERVFQAETEGQPAVQVLGPLEAAGARFDGLWVMGMNDHQWPPVPRPNPLLPAAAQRRAQAPAASAEVEAAFARAIHGRLRASAPEVIFSWARQEGDRALRPSPLLAGLPATEAWPPAPPLLAGRPAGEMQRLADHRAPPLAPGEAPAGGARLFQLQALCPAWAYYRYRLGARRLESAAEGLDARTRGNLVHRVLEVFWQHRGLDDLLALAPAARGEAVAAAADLALGEESGRRDEPLPPRLAALERQRLTALVLGWLDLEAGRPAGFRVVAREREEAVEIAGLPVSLRVDRVDQLEDGRRLILDYKTGGTAGVGGWLQERPGEVQLPLYAAFAPEGAAIAGIALARVVRDQPAFAGLAAAGDLLPSVKGVADWPALVAAWRQRLEALGREIAAGWSPVSFARERDLDYCEVLPLLRLPEARAWTGRAGDGDDAGSEAGP